MSANFLSGYVPEEDLGPGPLYPGYYAGKPIPKKPGSKNYLKPIEFDYDYLATYIDGLSADTSRMSSFIKDKIVDDFKQNLKATYRAPDVPLETLDDYDSEVLPGVFGMSLSLNPDDWTDPKKQFTKTVKDWAKQATGLQFNKEGWGITGWESSDYENRVKTVLWANVLGVRPDSDVDYNDVNGNGGGGNGSGSGTSLKDRAQDYYRKSAKKAFAKSVEAIATRTAFGNEGIEGENNPFYIAKSGILDSYTGKDVFGTVAQDVIKFETGIRTGQKRQSNYDSFVRDSSIATAEELKNEFLVTANSKTSGIDYVVTGWKNSNIPEAYAPAVEIFAAKAQNAKKMFLFNLTSTGDEGLLSSLEKKLAGQRGDITDDALKTDYLNPIAYLKDGKSRIDLYREAVEAEKKRIIDYASGNWMSDAIPTELRDQVVADLERQTKSYIQALTNIEKILEDGEKMNPRQLYSRLKSVTSGTRGMTGKSLDNIRAGFIRELEDGLYLAPHASRSQSGRNVHNLSAFMADPNIVGYRKADGSALYSRRLLPIGRRLMTENTSNYAQDIYEAAAGGKLIERYVWNKATTVLTGYTPAELLRNQLTKVNYFGMIIDDNYVTKRQAADKLFNAQFRYKFDLSIDTVNDAGKAVKVTKKISGGLHMRAVDFFTPLSQLPKGPSQDEMMKMFLGHTSFEDFIKEDKARLWNIPALTRNSLMDSSGNLTKVGLSKKKQVEDFRKWLQNNEFKIDFTKPENRNELKSLLSALAKENRNPDTLKITTQYAGHIQKIAVRLNKLQTKLFGKLAPFLKPLFQLKNNISEKLAQLGAEALSRLLSKLASGALAGATAGLGALLDPLIQKFIKPLIQFVVRKVLDFGQAFVGGIIKGDIWQAFSALEKEVNNLVKVGMYIGAMPFILIFVISLGFLNTNMGSNSPIDPTKGNQGYSGYYLGGGAEQFVRVEKNVTVSCVNTAICGTMTNPTISIPNDALAAGIRVRYTVVITPQITFTDFTGISFDDETVIRYGTAQNRQSETIYERDWGAGEITSFNPQEPITLELPESGDLILHEYPDSRVTNTFNVHLPAIQGRTQGPSQATATRSFRIGDPTIGEPCFEYVGAWPSTVRANFEQAAEEVGMNSGSYYPDLCAAGQITFTFVDAGSGGCNAEHMGGGNIEYRIGSGCTLQYNVPWLTFWIAHETFHVYQSRFAGIVGSFSGAVAGEPGMPTYPYHSEGANCWRSPGCQTNAICPSEDQAEAFGNYFHIDSYGGSCYTGTTDWASFWAGYPLHRQFIENNIF